MTRMVSKTAAAVIASAFMAVSVLPAEAMPVMNPAQSISNNIETVEYRGGGDRYHGNRGNRGRGYDRGYDRRHYNGGGWGYRPPPPRGGYYGNNNDAWVPLAILGAGALIIGGAVAANQRNQPQRTYGINPQHYNWCEARYRSYRPADNTFQPYNGPRKQCLSPYY
nr:BA14K family protein [Marinicella sp. W31]MDC2877772.1 BA14K family protein [Marinicella sp. W31]